MDSGLLSRTISCCTGQVATATSNRQRSTSQLKAATVAYFTCLLHQISFAGGWTFSAGQRELAWTSPNVRYGHAQSGTPRSKGSPCRVAAALSLRHQKSAILLTVVLAGKVRLSRLECGTWHTDSAFRGVGRGP